MNVKTSDEQRGKGKRGNRGIGEEEDEGDVAGPLFPRSVPLLPCSPRPRVPGPIVKLEPALTQSAALL
jgi:hypothetical protein